MDKIDWFRILIIALVASLIGMGNFAYQWWSVREHLKEQTKTVDSLSKQLLENKEMIDELKESISTSTLQLIEKESITQSSVEGFCDQTTEVFEFANAINFSDALEDEKFVVCSDSSWQQWPQGGQGVLSLWVVKQQRAGYDVFWGRKTLEELNLRSVAIPEIVDINNDGIDEIFISGSNWGGTCTGITDYYYLYEPSQDEMFLLQSKQWFDDSCENLVQYPIEISDNLENDAYSMFKNFLEGKMNTK